LVENLTTRPFKWHSPAPSPAFWTLHAVTIVGCVVYLLAVV
jgi:hypothetical protein